jgi:predicted metal-dependent hydrolase
MKNLRLKVYPNGLIKLSAPLHTHPEKIHTFLMSRLDWIQQSQKQLQQRQVETPRHPESDNKRYRVKNQET